MRPQSDIYESCNFSSIEPNSFAKASKEAVWIKSIKEEMKIIKKNNTWELVNRTIDKDVIWVE